MQKAVRKKDLKVIERPISLRDMLEKLKAEGDLIESRQAGQSRPRTHRPAEASRWRLPDAVQQGQGQAQPSPAHQPVRRHQRHQQDVRLDGRHRPHPQARLCALASAQAAGDHAERGAVPGGGDQESGRRQQVHGADPAHDLRAGTHRRLRHPLRHRRALRGRLRPRLQPHELPLGQRRHVPDLARLAHVAGRQQILQARRAGSDHHVLRRAAGLHAARRRGIRLRHHAAGLRRDRHRRRGAGRADSPRQGAHRQRHGAGRRRDRAGGLRQSERPPLRDQGVRGLQASRAATISIRNGPATWARPTRRRPSTSPR